MKFADSGYHIDGFWRLLSVHMVVAISLLSNLFLDIHFYICNVLIFNYLQRHKIGHFYDI